MSDPRSPLTDPTNLDGVGQLLRQARPREALAKLDGHARYYRMEKGSDLPVRGQLLFAECLLLTYQFERNPSILQQLQKTLDALSTQLRLDNFYPGLVRYYRLRGKTRLLETDWFGATVQYEKLRTSSVTAENRAGRLVALNGLGEVALLTNDLGQAEKALNRSLELLIEHTDEAQYGDLVENYRLHAQLYRQKKEHRRAEHFLQRALDLSREQALPVLHLDLKLLRAELLLDERLYIDALLPLLEARRDSQFLNYDAATARANFLIGLVYNGVFYYARSLSIFEEIRTARLALLCQHDQVRLLNQYGKALFRTNRYDEAKRILKSAEELAKEGNYLADLLYNLAFQGKISNRRQNFPKALRYAKKVDQLARHVGDANGIQINYINLGSVHCQLEKYNEGIKLLSRGIAAAKRLKDNFSEIRGYQIMAEIFRKKKDYKSAVMYQMIYTKFYEDFYQQSERQRVLETEHRFEMEALRQRLSDPEKAS